MRVGKVKSKDIISKYKAELKKKGMVFNKRLLFLIEQDLEYLESKEDDDQVDDVQLETLEYVSISHKPLFTSLDEDISINDIFDNIDYFDENMNSQNIIDFDTIIENMISKEDSLYKKYLKKKEEK